MPESHDLSASMQDYLEAILELEEEENQVRITDIANKLNIAKASVNQTIHKFKEMGLVRQQIYGPVELTDNGREMADKVKQRHKKLSHFLIGVLGVDPKIAEKDACLMEHAVSSETMERLTDFLSRNGYMKDDIYEKKAENNFNIITVALSDLKTGQKGKVVKVASKGEVRRRIMEMGIITGTEILVKGFAPFGDPMELGIKGYNLSLRKSEASDIMVELL
jgi:DtxR family transcriptional regulator, Mn-dependent transcriptional regulator